MTDDMIMQPGKTNVVAIYLHYYIASKIIDTIQTSVTTPRQV